MRLAAPSGCPTLGVTQCPLTLVFLLCLTRSTQEMTHPPVGQPGVLYFCTSHNGEINLALTIVTAQRGQGGSRLMDGALNFPPLILPPSAALFSLQKDIEATWPCLPSS